MFSIYSCSDWEYKTTYAPINVKPLGGGRPGVGGGFDGSHRPVVRTFDRFNGLSSSILLTLSCYFDKIKCPGVGHLNRNSQLSSNVPPLPGLPPSSLTLIGALKRIVTIPSNSYYFNVIRVI